MSTEFNSPDTSTRDAPLASTLGAYNSADRSMYVLHVIWQQSAVTAYNDDGGPERASTDRWNFDVRELNRRMPIFVEGQPWRYKQLHMYVDSRDFSWGPDAGAAGRNQLRPFDNRFRTTDVPDGLDNWTLQDSAIQLPWPHRDSGFWVKEPRTGHRPYPWALDKYDEWRQHNVLRFSGLWWPTHVVHDIDGSMLHQITDPGPTAGSPSIVVWLLNQLHEWARQAWETYEPRIDMWIKDINPGGPDIPPGSQQRWVLWTSHILACLPRANDAWQRGQRFEWPACEDVPE